MSALVSRTSAAAAIPKQAEMSHWEWDEMRLAGRVCKEGGGEGGSYCAAVELFEAVHDVPVKAKC